MRDLFKKYDGCPDILRTIKRMRQEPKDVVIAYAIHLHSKLAVERSLLDRAMMLLAKLGQERAAREMLDSIKSSRSTEPGPADLN